MNLEDVLCVSVDRVADCRNELDAEFIELIERFERSGYVRKEVLVALSEVIAEEFSSLPGLPRVH